MQLEGIGQLVLGVMTTLSLSFFHKIKLQDTIIILIGLASIFSINLIRGVVLYKSALYITYASGSLMLDALIGCRGFVAKIVPENELGKQLKLNFSFSFAYLLLI